jgi:hypothetical protein
MTDVPAELDQAAITTRLDAQQKLLRASVCWAEPRAARVVPAHRCLRQPRRLGIAPATSLDR